MTLTKTIAGAVDPLEDVAALDAPAALLRRLAGVVPGKAADVLHGIPIGHPAHPILAQSTLGCFVSASVLDLTARHPSASRALIGFGLLSSAPTALAGVMDLSAGHEQQQRVGVVHAASNAAGLLCYGFSFAQRLRGRSGRASAAIGLAALSAGGYLGGHLAYRQSLGPNHAEHVPHRAPADWTALCSLAELPDGQPVQRILGDQPLAARRRGGQVDVLADVCSHLSGPLHEGEWAEDCVTCPWHGSRFGISDGQVRKGPATAPIPVFEVRVEDGQVLVRLPGAG
jgi:nitrite reductase/ring-hydroxylating ferredoxin subunit/uncharacterized membrane protein